MTRNKKGWLRPFSKRDDRPNTVLSRRPVDAPLRRAGSRIGHRPRVGASSVRLGLLLVLILQWGPLQGALSEGTEPVECNPAVVDTNPDCVIDAIPEEGGDVALAADIWRDDRHLPGNGPAPEAEAVESDGQSDAGTADGQSRERFAGAAQGGTQSAIVGVLVTLTFGLFGLLFVTRRRFSHDG